MEKISACIITKNEEENIERCLLSLDWVDEIIIVDSGSEDSTKEICKKYQCRFFETKWLGFGKTKKFAVSKSTNNWILSIDADEEISIELKYKIQAFLKSPVLSGVYIKRISYYLGNQIRFCGWQNDYPLRIFDKRKANFNENLVHESVVIEEGNTSKFKEPIFHHPYKNINEHLKKINFYTELSAQSLSQSGKRSNPIYAISSALVKFIKMYVIKLGFLDGLNGLTLSIISSYSSLIKYLKLWSFNKK